MNRELSLGWDVVVITIFLDPYHPIGAYFIDAKRKS